jgi:hypothetical protein
MRNLLIFVIAAVVLGTFPARVVSAQEYNLKAERQQLRTRQKEQWKALKFQQKSRKQGFQGQPIPKSMRLQMKHQMERDRRELREKHRDELQDMKDRQRMFRESQKAYGQH